MDSLPNGKMPVVKETAKLALGELAVSALTVGVYLLIGKFTPGVVVGTLAGTLVILLNFFLLAYSVNRVFDDMMEKRGSGEMSEEEIAKFTETYKAQAAMKTQASFLLRTLLLIAVPVACFLLPFADGIASLVPLLAERPLLSVIGLLSSPKGQKSGEKGGGQN